MSEARRRHARVPLAFGRSMRRHRQMKLPSRRQYRKQIRAVRKRYPFVKTFQAWNEANHGFQPTHAKPWATGRLYDVLVRTCRGCVVTAPSVMLTGGASIRWIERFERAAERRVRIWAVHNHIDANRNSRHRTRMFLGSTRGPVWFTEAGAIWNRWMPNRRGRGWHKVRRYNRRTAVRAIRSIFKLARFDRRRVKRIYVYNSVRPRSAHALRSECEAPRLRRAQLDLAARAHGPHTGVVASEQAVEPATDVALGDVAAAHDKAQ